MNEESQNTLVLFKTEDEQIAVDVLFEDETVWLTQTQMAELFQRDRTVISKHIKNIFTEGELDKESNVQNLHIANSDKPVEYYNLDVIISVGYRVKSRRGTEFRRWATKRLNEYIRKGYTLDDTRLKNLGGAGYWSELIDRIRDIRASEKVFYRQILEIYATSIDYDAKSDTSVEFFRKVQNKIHFAVHGQTAAEVIYTRADAEKEFMGLTAFEGKQPHLKDALIAKNYLDEKELKTMGQIVSGYLDFAERQAERKQPMTMKDWAEHLDRILTAGGEKLLTGAGSISHTEACAKATAEYRKYQQKTLSDVESAFLDSIHLIERTAENKRRKP